MIIKNKTISKRGSDLILSVDVQTSSGKQLPESLWFCMPKKWKGLLSDSYNAFVSTLLFPCMVMGEDLEIEGKIDPLFHSNLMQYQQYYKYWYPDILNIIEIKPSGYKKTKEGKQKVITSFSGGADSFYSLIENLANPVAGYKLTHGFFINGFDILLEDQTKTYGKASEAYDQLFKKLGLELITLSTNARHFLDPFNIIDVFDWNQMHGSLLAAVGLLFCDYFDQLVIPSSDPYNMIVDGYGTTPISDRLLNTNNFNIIHHGCEATKHEKVTSLTEHEITYDHLRVCWENPNGLQNCGKCYKCTSIMMHLDSVGGLENYATFPSLTDEVIDSFKLKPSDPGFIHTLPTLIEKHQKRGNQKLVDKLRSLM